MVDFVGFRVIQISPCWKHLPILTGTLPRPFCREVKYFLTSNPNLNNTICGVSVHIKQVVSLTVNQHGPFPFTKNQSTDKTGRWGNPEGCWAYLPVSDHNRWSLQGADLFEKKMIQFELFQWIDPARGGDTDMYVKSLWSRSFFLRWITEDPSPWGNFTPPTKH